MNLNDLKFTKEHEWVRLEGQNASIGITDYAQKELGDVVYVELPAQGEEFAKGDACSNIESVKAVSDIYIPISGEVVEVNSNLEDKPELINQSPYDQGWIFRVKVGKPQELDALLTLPQYEEYLKGISEE
jgi:glycine cleavage system H protein